MTEFFNYDDLTWPEVVDLPRNLPIVLLLGTGYPLDKVSECLGNPERVGLLPAIPFGWRNSGLEVSEFVLSALVQNLLNSVRDDGFTQVFALAPQGVNIGNEPGTIHLASRPCQIELIPPETEKSKVILIPIGHTEQHSLHLPLSVDTTCIEAVGIGTAIEAADQAYCLPVMPYGVSTHRSSFAATMNSGGRAFEDFWMDVVHTLTIRGFDKFYLMSGHGGSSSFLVNVVKYAGEQHRRIFCATAFLYLSGPSGVASLEKYRDSKIGGMGHACELETSLMLALRPELVHMERVVDDTDFITTDSYFMDWVEGGALVANPPWDDDSIFGAYGAGSFATAEKGNLWLKAAIKEKIGHVQEIHEQQLRREERRNAGFGLWGQNK